MGGCRNTGEDVREVGRWSWQALMISFRRHLDARVLLAAAAGSERHAVEKPFTRPRVMLIPSNLSHSCPGLIFQSLRASFRCAGSISPAWLSFWPATAPSP